MLNTYNKNPLTFDQIAQIAPAVFTQKAAPTTSDKYGFVSTLDAIAILADYGFAPFAAHQTQSRKKGGLAYADHMLRFRSVEAFSHDGRNVPELIIINGHSGKKALTIGSGVFRFACANGLLVADKGQQAKLRHTHLTAAGFEDLIKQQAQDLPAVMDRIDAMESQTLTNQQALDFAYNAASLRWELLDENKTNLWTDGVESGSYAVKGYSVPELLNVHRPADKEQTLYNVFNRCQEKLIRGGLPVLSLNAEKRTAKWRKAAGINAIKENVRLNKSLWDLAEWHLGAAA